MQTVQRHALTDEEVRQLLEAAGSRRAVYLTAINTGLRRAELAALQKGDCSLYGDNAFLKVRASTTKNSKAASIWLNDEVAVEWKNGVDDPDGKTLSCWENPGDAGKPSQALLNLARACRS